MPGRWKIEILLDIPTFIHYNIIRIGVWRSLVSRLVRVQEASGSNPDTPTTGPSSNGPVSFSHFHKLLWKFKETRL